MEIVALLFIRSVIRYFVPGLVFYLVVFFLPAQVFFGGLQSVGVPQPLDVTEMVAFAIVLGYALDAVGAYRWTLHYSTYLKTKRALAASLMPVAGDPSQPDPDYFLSDLWLSEPEVHERLMQERAEWVLVLELSFALLVGGAIALLVAAINVINRQPLQAGPIVMAALEIAVAFLASRKGVQRVWPYNRKAEMAVKAMRASADAKRSDLDQNHARSSKSSASRR